MFSISPRIDDDTLLGFADELSGPFEIMPPLWTRAYHASRANRESEVQNTDKEFRVRVNMKHYKPEEIKITSDNQRITIHAKHEEKQDGHGFVSREITRVFKIPEDVDARSVTSTITYNGILNIKAIKVDTGAPKEMTIPVEFRSC
ncbi:heat shock protein Hsp-12.2-like [Physella acuta]|uniref:heat shock protein Hsp-12.2-like n=1 Tax=Physella acuta TaxID=109671 RepID=UPI0027DBDE65|nr:heat shock protein Hsp-12.2-like [Physella acuta]